MVLKSFAPQVGWAFTIGLSLLLAFQIWLIWILFSCDGCSGSDQCQDVGNCCWNSTRSQHQHLRRSQEQTSGFSVSLCCETETATWLKSSLGWFSFLSAELITLLCIAGTPLPPSLFFFFKVVRVIGVVSLHHPRKIQGNPSKLCKRRCSDSEAASCCFCWAVGTHRVQHLPGVCCWDTKPSPRFCKGRSWKSNDHHTDFSL